MFDNKENQKLQDTLANNLNNALAPISTNIGQTIGDLWFVVFGFISQRATLKRLKYQDEVDRYQKETLNKINNIPPQELTDPDIQIVGQALEKSKYCVTHEELRNMFASLIASSMQKSKKAIIHPSFADIIQKMSADDAYALTKYFPKHGDMEIINIRLVNTQDRTFKTILSNVWLPYSDISNLYKGSMIINSLSRLGLVEVNFNQVKADNTIYNQIFNNELVDTITNQLTKSNENLTDQSIEMQKGIVGVTDFGRAFLSCVT